MAIDWQTIGAEVPSRGNRASRWLGRALLRSCGWTLSGEIPNRRKFIIAVAPHTSNFDFVLTVGVILSLGLQTSYLAKASLFRFPLGPIMRFFGGIPVNRSNSSDLVAQLAARFASSPGLILGITPEGTRASVRRWRTGFALIAAAAKVPVLPAVINYTTKVVTFANLIVDVADAEATLNAVKRAAATGRGRDN